MKILKIYILLSITSMALGNCTATKMVKYQGRSFLLDKRDGTRYPVTRINGRLWTTRNATFAVPGSSYYPNPMHNPIDSRGRTYTWEQAKEACPKGWRLPTAKELADLFLAYGKVSYSGELSYFKEMFGPYQPDSTFATYQALLKDSMLNLPIYKTVPDKAGYYIQRTLFWSSDGIVGNHAYAVYWDEEKKAIHFGNYPEWYFGFCRFIKKERPSRKQRKELERKRSIRRQKEDKAAFFKDQFE